ncbi:uncharacterized protein LOC122043664 [Zingiber officinale]|uniref:Uncharacterized protein n=1 Tax=Zingiber officinale TaxID=94328 RepID=A0A8J5LJQ2_ZINOF|nr:uncharacterized protein LOC122043664 [Zingiber officinale]KAG6527791.1 hypothetical protein ZIOFF_009920 [Zingiber officinale]
MAAAMKTIRRAFLAFFRSYPAFAGTAALLSFPFSAASLLAHSLGRSSPALLRPVSSRLGLLFHATGFPPSHLFTLLHSRLSLSIFASAATLPFDLTFLVLAQAAVVRVIYRRPTSTPSLFSLRRLYPALALTHLRNALFVLAANAAVLSILCLAFNALATLRLSTGAAILAVSASGVILYSFSVASASAACNLATVISASEGGAGWRALREALAVVRGRTATAVALSLPASLGTAAIEALFRFRVAAARPCQAQVVWEALVIIYMRSLLLVLDTIIACVFINECSSGCSSFWSKDGGPFSCAVDRMESEDKVQV